MSTYFSLIPSGVYGNTKISDSSKLTYGLILGLANRNGYSYASNTYLSEQRGLSVSGIKRHLTELKDNGCIIIEFDPQNNRRITPIIVASQFEKVSKNSKNKQYDVNRDAIEDAMNLLWRQMK